MSNSHFWSPDQTAHPRRACGIGSIVPDENISFGSARQRPMRCENMGIASPGEQAAAPEKGSSSLNATCHTLVTLRQRYEHRLAGRRPPLVRPRPCVFSKRGGNTIPLASKVSARADRGTPDGKGASSSRLNGTRYPRRARAVRLLSRSYGSASRLSRSPSIAASSSRIPAISAASSRSTVLASLRCRDRPRDETKTSTRRRSPRSPRR